MFRTIVEAPNFEININGEVRSKITGAYRKHMISKFGYPYVGLQIRRGRGSPQRKVYIHREIAKQFLPNPDNLPVVCHIDDNPANFDINNLRWDTQKGNMRQSSDTGAYNLRKIDVVLRSPTGEKVEVRGLRPFCEEHQLDWGNMGHLRRGTNRVRSVKGWRLWDETYY